MTTLRTVLIIEDDLRFSRTIAAYLEDSGYRVFEAANGKQGLDLLDQVKPDVVLTDLRMPVLDGFEVITQMKGRSPAVPVIVITGTGDEEMSATAIQRGARAYFSKPIKDMHELENAINQVLTLRE